MAYQPSPELRARILSAARERPTSTRVEVNKKRLLWLTLSALPLVAMVLRSRPWAALWPLPKVIAVLVMASFSVLGASLLGRSGPAALRPREGLLAFSLASPIVFALGVVLSFGADSGGAPWIDHAHSHCFTLAVGLSLLPLLVAVRLARGGDPVHPTSLGGVFGAIAGAWAGMAMAILCPRIDLPHLLVGHGLPLLLLALVGAVLGRWWLGLRAEATKSP